MVARYADIEMVRHVFNVGCGIRSLESTIKYCGADDMLNAMTLVVPLNDNGLFNLPDLSLDEDDVRKVINSAKLGQLVGKSVLGIYTIDCSAGNRAIIEVVLSVI